MIKTIKNLELDYERERERVYPVEFAERSEATIPLGRVIRAPQVFVLINYFNTDTIF